MVARFVLYSFWLLPAVIFFLMAAWAQLEKMGKSHKLQNPSDFFNQGSFVLAVAIISIMVDQLFLQKLHDMTTLPLLLLQIAVFPAMLVAGAHLVGPSKVDKLHPVIKKNKYSKK